MLLHNVPQEGGASHVHGDGRTAEDASEHIFLFLFTFHLQEKRGGVMQCPELT